MTSPWQLRRAAGVAIEALEGRVLLSDTSNLIVAGNGDKRDMVSVEVAPDDGTVRGVMASDAATMAGTAPTLSGNIDKSVDIGSTLSFTSADFFTAFGDADPGDSLQKIRITSLPTHGTLRLTGVAVTLNQEIAAGQLDVLTYTPISRGADSFGWNGSDGSLYAVADATVNVTVAGVAPTSVVVYSSNPEIHYGETLRGSVLVTIPDALGVLPTGTISLRDTDGTVLQTVAMVNGQASFSIAGLKRGYHQIAAKYRGDANYNALRSATPLSVHVGAANVVDILAVYTPSALQEVNRQGASIKNLIYTAVADTNDALVNSQINLSLELVDVAQVNYTESGTYSTDLTRLQTPGDGYLDEVSSLRNAYGADLVCLFVGGAQSSNNVVGLGYVMNDVNAPNNANWGFTEIWVNEAANPYYALAHELGHNFGAVHDREHSDGRGVLDVSYGYRYQGSDGVYYHDLMSYETASSDVLIPYYSNPNVSYAGRPTGQAGYSNVAKTINRTAPVVASYRPTMVPLVTATQTTVLPLATGTIYRDLPVTLKARVARLSANPHTPEGTVTFFDGDAVLGTGNLRNGKAIWTGPLVAGSPHSIRALYQNDDYFGDSISAAMPVPVTRMSIAEHAAAGTMVGSAAGPAPAGHTLSYAITGGNTDDVFAIDGATGVIRVARPGRLDYEQAGSYRLQITASDSASPGATGTARVIVKLIDVNEAPTDVALTNYTVLEHLPAGAMVGKLIGSDPDAATRLTYTLVGGIGSRGNARFTILSGKLWTAGIFDCSAKSIYKIRIRVTDQGQLWYEKPMVINVVQ